MTSEDDWSWQFRKPAKRTSDDLDDHARTRITDKLDEIVHDQWREPDDYLRDPDVGVLRERAAVGARPG
jgi:mRNA-degrading endonuclease RelE of RelBE toxin-antitoxin system